MVNLKHNYDNITVHNFTVVNNSGIRKLIKDSCIYFSGTKINVFAENNGYNGGGWQYSDSELTLLENTF